MNLSQVECSLEKLPKGTDAYHQAYEEAMERIQSQKQGFRNLSFKALLWISCAKEPLSPQELQHALAVVDKTLALDGANITKVELIVSSCAGLVIIDEASIIIRLVHHTAQEYLQTTRDTWFPNAETVIANTCITYLSFDTFQSGACQPKYETLEARLQLHPLYKYAAKYWGYHTREASVEVQKVLNFLEDEAKVSASIQMMFFSRSFFSYDLQWLRPIPGVHLAACLGLGEVTRVLCEKRYHRYFGLFYGLMKPLLCAARNGPEIAAKRLLDKYRELRYEHLVALYMLVLLKIQTQIIKKKFPIV